MDLTALKSVHKETSAADGRASYHDMARKLIQVDSDTSVNMVENPAIAAAAQRQSTAEPSSVVDPIKRLELISTSPNIFPLIVDCRRNKDRLEGSLTLEEFVFSQFYRPGMVSSWTVVFVSERAEAAITVRENQKRYHPDQPVLAFCLDNVRVMEVLENIRQQQVASGKLKRFRTGIGGKLLGRKSKHGISNIGTIL